MDSRSAVDHDRSRQVKETAGTGDTPRAHEKNWSRVAAPRCPINSVHTDVRLTSASPSIQRYRFAIDTSSSKEKNRR